MTTRYSRYFVLLAVLLMTGVGLLLGACGGSDTTTTTAPATGTTGASIETATTLGAGVEWPMLGPTVIDVPTEEISNSVISSAGGVIQAGAVGVAVPGGAVAADTTIVITRLSAPFHTDSSDVADPKAVSAVPISSAYDFGPAGVVFAKPVTITLPYDAGFGPEGIDPERVAIAYFNGEQWVIAGGTVDASKRTVSVQVQAFEGSTAMDVLLTGPGGELLSASVNRVVDWYYGPESVKDDPVSRGEAEKWITPKDPVVQKQAEKAVILDQNTKETKPLDDPDLAKWLEDAVNRGDKPTLAYEDSGGTRQGTYDDGPGSNWQKPADYFTSGAGNGGALSGDCTDTTSAAVSVFTAKGFHVKGVFGYGGGDKHRPHAWGEVLIGNEIYRIDETGGLITPESNAFHFTEYQPPTDTADPRYKSMWDDQGQEPYDKDWWKKPLAIGAFAGTYKGSMPLTYGSQQADVPWEVTVDDEGNVKGGFEYSWGDEVSSKTSLTITGQVSADGRLTGSVTATNTVMWNGQPRSGSSQGSLSGEISGEEFVMVGQSGSAPVTATRQ